MKVIYKKSITEEMDEAILMAKYEYPEKEIEKFVLTHNEYNELSEYMLKYCHYVYITDNPNKVFPSSCEYRGIKVEKED